MSKVSILVVDDHQVVRLGLQTLLNIKPDFEVVGQAATADEAIAAVAVLQPQIVLMDLRLPGRSGVEACREIKTRWPHIHVIMLTSFANDELVLDAINAGAEGYVLKRVQDNELVEGIRAVARGEAILDPVVTAKLMARVRQAEQEMEYHAFQSLSKREMEVLNLVAQGKTNAEIGQTLHLSEKTVGNHVSTILSKLDVTNRIEAATYAVRHHIERYLSAANREL
ncbi:MAG: Transcriptional regulatory protein LiaR [Anaerolineae bacterium]|nr:Transcriptional regulatory protein LiaR [Anaerolineae bacterium]